MYPQPLFCSNDACPSRGCTDADNLVVHDSLKQRYRCRTCGKTFTHHKGTVFHRLKTDPKTVEIVLSLLAFGCPRQAIVRAFDVDERTIARWQQRAGRHCQAVHEALVQTPQDLQQIQADEIRVKMQSRVVLWLAMAICVPTRLWLGGVVSPKRDARLLGRLARLVNA